MVPPTLLLSLKRNYYKMRVNPPKMMLRMNINKLMRERMRMSILLCLLMLMLINKYHCIQPLPLCPQKSAYHRRRLGGRVVILGMTNFNGPT